MNGARSDRNTAVEDLIGFDRHEHFGLLVLILVALLLLSGIGESGWIRLTTAALNVVVLLVAVGRPQNRRQTIAVIGVAAIGALGAVLVVRDRVDGIAGAVGASLQVVVLIGVTLVVLIRLSRHQTVTTQTLFGAVAAYMLIGHVFAWAYLALPGYLEQEVIQPVAAGEIPLYYSFVVLTTLGFGDIQPVGALARRVTVLEVLVGQLFLAILISRLVSVWSRSDRRVRRRRDEGSAD